MDKLLDVIEEDMKIMNRLQLYLVGIALKVIEDRMWDIDSKIAQRCNDLQKKILP